MGTIRNEDGFSILAFCLVESANHEKACEFALSTCRRLERYLIQSNDFSQVLRKIMHQLKRALKHGARRQGV